MQHAYKRILLTIFAILVPFCSANADPIPAANFSSPPLFSQVQDQQLGEAFMREIRRTMPLVQDPVVNAYIQSLGNRLVAASSASYRPFHFFILRNPTINAFAGPGGYIGVNSGLLLSSRSESELASVLAHEIAHVSQNHLSRRLEQAKQMNLISMGGTLAALLLGTVTNSEVASGAMMAVMGNNIHQALEFSRSHEREADRVGMGILNKAGFDPQAMPRFFANMQKLSFSSTQQMPEFLRTHPNTDYRIADTQNRIEGFAAKPTPSSLDYYLVREKLRVNNAIAGHQILNYYVHILKTQKYDNKAAVQYGYALALLKSHQLAEAKQQLKPLIHSNHQEILYQMAMADIDSAAYDSAAALRILKHASELNPEYYPVQLQYATALVSAEQMAPAIKLLRKLSFRYPNNPNIYELLARAESKSGHMADAYQARAQALTLSGELTKALLLLQQAKQLPDLTQNTKLILDARITDLRKQILKTQTMSRK